MKKYRSYILWAALLVLIDQVTKILVKGFDLGLVAFEGYKFRYEPVIGDWLRFTFVENPGMAFGITFGWGKILLSLFSVLASVVLFRIITSGKTNHKGVLTGLTLVLAGAFGNMIDRVFYGVFYGEGPLFYGKVVDFIDVEFPDFSLFGSLYTRWPVFNVADSCVTVGMILLLVFNKHLPFADNKPKTQEIDSDTISNEASASSQQTPHGES